MFELMDSYSQNAVIKVLGVGGGGGNAVQHMVESGIEGVDGTFQRQSQVARRLLFLDDFRFSFLVLQTAAAGDRYNSTHHYPYGRIQEIVVDGHILNGEW